LRVHRGILVGATITVLFTSCATESGNDRVVPVTRPPTATPDASGPLLWDDCGDGIECSTLEVPFDHDDPSGERIDLAVVRRRVTHDERRLGTLVVNPGGPGSSGIEYVRSGAVRELNGWFDVVSWDPRGVGESTPLRCATSPAGRAAVEQIRTLDPEPDGVAEQRALEDIARQLADLCADLDGAYLEQLDTSVNALDLELLRRSLGEREITFLGYSYGTLLGQEYARVFPRHLRAMALDGVVDPATSLPEFLHEQAVGLDAAIEPVASELDAVAAQLEARPLEVGDDTVGPAELALAAFASTYSTGGTATLRTALSEARRGNGRPLAQLAERYTSSGDYLAYVAVLCADGPRPAGVDAWRQFAADLSAAAPRLGAATANELLPCAFWPAPPTRQPDAVAPRAMVGALVIGTTGDVATPYADAVRVAERLPGAVLLTHDADGHTGSGSRCVADVLRRYLVELELPEPGTVCAS
jgi:pimeloyl-ACP methyl ester carboxylesterase